MPAPCAFEGCSYDAKCLGLCNSHRRQQLAGQELRPLRPRRATGATAIRDEQGRKFCPKCERWLPVEIFKTNKASRDGLHAVCPTCSQLRRHRLPFARYEEILESQGALCGICQSPDSGKRSWHIDHDHACCPGEYSCGKCVRGLLCYRCNTLLGVAGDDPARLARAIRYLELWEACSV